MNHLTSYITRQLVSGTLLVTAGLACILWLTQSLRFIDWIIKKGTSVGTFIYITLLLLPNFLVYLLPFALLLAVLVIYHKLTTDRELMVMRGAGLSNLGLGKPALLWALSLTMVGYVMTLYLVPVSVEQFRETRWELDTDVSGLLLQEGVFSELFDGVTVYVRERSDDGSLIDVLVHDKRNPDKISTYMAERGMLTYVDGTPIVRMINGSQQDIVPGSDRLSLLYFDSYSFELGGMEDEAGIRFRDARERSLSDLLTAQAGPDLSDVDMRRFRIEAHQRLTNPLYSVTYCLIALAFLLPGSFNRRGQGEKIVGALFAMVVVQASALGVANLATKHLTLVPLIYLNALLPAAIALYVLTRGWDRRPRRLPAAAAAR